MKHLLLLFCLVFTSWQINAQYCTPSVLDCSVGDEIDSFTIPNAGFSHLSTGCSANTYGDFTGDSTLEIDLPVGTTYDFEITHNFGSQFVKIWIDFNSNQTFEDSEIIFTSTAGADPTQGSFTIPGTVTQGSTRMRIIDVFALEPDDSCTPSGTYGETHDYTVNLLPPPACPIPSNVALDIAQGQTADFTWDDVPEATSGYIWEVYAQGDDPDTATAVSSGTFPAGSTSGTATGLSEISDYDFYLTADCDTDGTSLTFGPVNFTTPPLCPVPDNFEAVNAQTTSVELNWTTIPNDDNGYNWSVFNQGDDPANDQPVVSGNAPSGDSSVTVTGLSENTVYEAYIETDCGTDGVSDLSNAVSFSTPCVAITAPVTEDFDGSAWVAGTGFANTGSTIDNCWNRTPDGTDGDYFWGTRTAATGSTGTGPSSANSGANYLFTEGSNGVTDDEAFFVSPLIDLSTLSEPALTFYYHMFGADMGTLAVDVNDGSGYDLDVFAISGPQQAADTDAFIEQIIDLSAYSGQTVSIRFRGTRGDGFTSDMAIDDFSVDEAPTCIKPSNLLVEEVFTESVEISWSAISNATAGYIWEAYQSGDDPAVETPLANGTFPAGTTTGVATGLTELTDYDLYLISDCDTDGTSDLAGPLSFSTLAICPSPSNIIVDNITEDAADVNWDESFNASNGYDWELFLDGEDPAVDTPVQSGNEAFGITSLNLTGLTDNTDYDFYITSDCDTDGVSLTEGPVNFLTLPLPPNNDDICDATALTVGVIPPGDTYTNLGATAQTDEPEAQCFNGGINGSVWFTFVAPASGEVEVSTDIAGATFTDTEVAVYEAPTDCTDPSTVGAELGCAQDNGTVIGFNSIVNVSGLTAGETYYVQVDAYSDFVAAGDFGISVIDTNPPCPAPTNVVLDSKTTTTADLSWDAVAEATDGYNWYLYDAGADVTVDPEVASGSVPDGTITASITGLTASTPYDFYVEANCGSSDGLSSFSDVFSFTTDCDVFTAPYSDNFDGITWTSGTGFGNDGDEIDGCWSRNPGNGNDYFWGTRTGETGSTGTGPATDLSGSGNYVFTESSNGVQGDEANFETPLVDVSSLNSPVVKFNYHMFGDDMGTLHIDVDDGSGYVNDILTITGPQQTDLNDPWIEEFVDLGTFSGQTIKVRFRGEKGDGFTSDMAIDEVSIQEAPTCLKPNGVTLVNEFFDSGEFSWNPITNATAGYLWEIYLAGDDPAADTPVSTGSVPAGTTQTVAGGLNPETDYEFYVISDCGTNDGLSELSQPVAFTTTELCSIPDNFEANNAQPTSVDLSWTTIPNDNNGYNWSVFNQGDDPVNDTPVASGNAPSGSSSVNVTGLIENTTYEAYIETDCGVDGTSDLSAPVVFSTTCTAFTAPVNENFDGSSWVSGTGFGNDGDAIDGCWDRTPVNNGSDYFWGTRSGETGSGNTGPDNDFSGNGKYVFTEASNGAVGDEALLESPLIDASGLNVPQLRFYYHMFGDDMGTLHVDVNDGNGYSLDEFTISGEQQTSGDEDWVLVVVNLPNFNVSNLRVRFRGERGDGFGSDMAIDEFSLVEAPTCPQPSDLDVSNVTNSTADVSWTAALANQDTFDLEVVPSGTTPTGTPTTEDVTSNPFTLTGLTSETQFDVYVRADCGGGDESFWIGPATFQTAITPVNVSENNPSTGNTYCYDNGEFKEWLFVKTGSSNEDLKITFNAGLMETDPLSSDQLLCYDGFDDSATVLYDSNVDGNDLTDITLTAPSGAIYMTLFSDQFGSCENGTEALEEIEFDVYVGTLSSAVFEKNNFEFYPNPVDDRLILNAQSNMENVILFDMIGQKVKEFNSVNKATFEIPMSNLQAGAYLMKVSIDGVSNTFRVIKE